MDHRALKRAGRVALTLTKVEALRPRKRRYEVTDSVARGLQLRIEPTGRKIWLHRYTWHAESVRLTLDEYEYLPLLDARTRIKVNQDLLHRGIDPRTAQPPRRQSKRHQNITALPRSLPRNSSLEDDARREITQEIPLGWPSDAASQKLLQALMPCPIVQAHSIEFLIYEFFYLFIVPGRKDKAGVARILRTEILAHWRCRDARTITPREIIQRLDAVVRRGARVMANRVAATLHQLFLHGVHRATIESSPVQLLYPPGGKEVSRTRVLSNEEIGRFLAHRFEICPTERLARALTVFLLTAVRRSELCLAKWEHIDLEKRTWRIPTEHTKSGREFLVYLTKRLVAEFTALKRLSSGSKFVIPRADPSRPIIPSALTQSLHRSLWRFQLFGIAPFTPHDLRRTCRTGMARIGIRRFVARRVLNHKQRGMDGVYDLHEYFKQKRWALRRWTNHCLELEAKASQPSQPVAPSLTVSSQTERAPIRQRRLHCLTRQELHLLVWECPMSVLCRRFDISNVWLAKICYRNRVPVPGRGYWAKRRAGYQPPIDALPRIAGDFAATITISGKDHVEETKRIAYVKGLQTP